jgi:ribosomal protein L37AE/L43A
MQNPALDQFVHQLHSQIVSVVLLCAIGLLFIGLPLYWLRLKLERKLIQMVRSARAAREARKIASTVGITQSGDAPHCPSCNRLMVKRKARQGSRAGAEFWGCSSFPKCRGTRSI